MIANQLLAHIKDLESKLKAAEAEREKWRELYQAAMTECKWHRWSNEECGPVYGSGTWVDPMTRGPIDAINDHERARAKHGVKENQ